MWRERVRASRKVRVNRRERQVQRMMVGVMPEDGSSAVSSAELELSIGGDLLQAVARECLAPVLACAESPLLSVSAQEDR
jgi:hypothetical protein